MQFKPNPNFKPELQRRIEQGGLEMAKGYLSEVTSTHENAARGGETLNRYGQPRSAPGQPPAPETGALRGAMSLNAVQYNIIVVGLDDEEIARRAAYLEYGTRRMAARPLWLSTLLQVMPRMASDFKRGFNQ